MNLAIVGYRNFHNYKFFKKQVKKYIKKHGVPSIIISGGAAGTDTLAERYAKEKGIKIKIYHAKWEKYGNSAGPKRNIKIITKCTHLLAFNSKFSKGTKDSIKKAQAVDKNVKVIKLDY